jgi:hypothetical protein
LDPILNRNSGIDEELLTGFSKSYN